MADQNYRHERYKQAQRWSKLSVTELKAELQKHDGLCYCKLSTRKYGSINVCYFLGRTATSTMLHVDWAPAIAVKNWIKATLEKDAPEESP